MIRLGKNPLLYNKYNLPTYLIGIKIAQETKIHLNRLSQKRKVLHRKYFIIRTVWFPMFKFYLLCYFYK